jgi:hypothetical protein
MRLGAGVGEACSCRFWVNEESVIEEGERGQVLARVWVRLIDQA